MRLNFLVCVVEHKIIQALFFVLQTCKYCQIVAWTNSSAIGANRQSMPKARSSLGNNATTGQTRI